jgi:hypothetical protein
MKVSEENKKTAFRQSLVTVFSGLVINFPLQFLMTYFIIEILDITSPLIISLSVAGFLTLTAIGRCYFINIYYLRDDNGKTEKDAVKEFLSK